MRIAGTSSHSTTMITRGPRKGGHEYVPLPTHGPMVAVDVEALAQVPDPSDLLSGVHQHDIADVMAHVNTSGASKKTCTSSQSTW